jgi:acyl-CoA synthetase (NDP forming)
VTSEAAAAAAAERLRGPLAIKGVGWQIQHKTEGGLVILGVEGAEAATEAYRRLKCRADHALEGVLLEKMIGGQRQFLVGLTRDAAFGATVAFGLGGVLTEVLGDVALALVPLDERQALELPDLIRARRLLDAFRGAPPVDRAALAAVIQAVAQISIDYPEIAEIDVNPLLVEGDRPVAVDALVLLSPAQAPRRPVRAERPDLEALFAPRVIAIVGASEDIRKWGGSALRNLLDGGYRGVIYPVNPRGGTYFGLKGYASLDELPATPDLVLTAVGGAQVKGVLEACVRRGVRAAVVVTAGFAETGAAGAELEHEIARLASSGHLTLIGPNCIGLISNASSLHATGFAAVHPPQATMSFISQSGSIGPIVVSACQRLGVGIEKFVSVGNQAVVDAFAVLDYLADDPRTESIMMYLEGVGDGRRFFESARRATQKKPVVLLCGGRTEAGSRAAASHTAAMAGSAAVFAAAARQAGVVSCTTVEELVNLGACFAYLPLPRGGRVAVVTNGGGPGVLAADEVALTGLSLAALPAELIAALDELLPPFWSRRNPLDLVALGFGDVGLRAIELVTRCDAVDAVMAINFFGVPSTGEEAGKSRADGEFRGFDAWEETYARRVVALMEETEKPIINVPDHPVRGSILGFGGRYAPVILPSPQAAARALDRMYWYSRYRLTLD